MKDRQDPTPDLEVMTSIPFHDLPEAGCRDKQFLEGEVSESKMHCSQVIGDYLKEACKLKSSQLSEIHSPVRASVSEKLL